MCYSPEVDLSNLVPHWILIVTFVCTVIVVHCSFNPFWTLLCKVCHPFELVFCYQFIIVVLLQSVWWSLYSPIDQSATNRTSEIVSHLNLLYLVRLLILCRMFSKLPMLHCQGMYQCQQVQLNWPYLFQRCASSFLGPNGCTHRWHLLWGFLIVADLRFMPLLCMCSNFIWTPIRCHIKISTSRVSTRPDFVN